MQFSILLTLAFTAMALASPMDRLHQQHQQKKRCIGSEEEIAAAKAQAQAALDAGAENPLVNDGQFQCQARGDGESFVCSDFLGSDC